MSQNLSKAGGTRLANTNERIDSDGMLNKIGTMAEQSLWEGLCAGLFNGRDGFIGLGCRPSKGAGDLDWLVDPGMGVITIAGGGAKETDFTPIFVDSQRSGTFAAHDPTNPRIDIISIAPLSVDDEGGIVKILTMGFLSPVLHQTRRRRSFQLTVTQGTPAPGPSAPATPAGHLLVGQFSIPATSGPFLAVADSRQLTGVASQANQHRPWKPKPTSLAAKVGNARTVTIQIRSLEGSAYAAPEGWPADNNQRYYLRARVYDDDFVSDAASYYIQAPGSASNVTAANKAEMIIQVGGGSETFTITVFDVTGAYTGTLYLDLTPILYYDAALAERGKGGVPVTIEMDWS